MAKRSCEPPKEPGHAASKQRARIAFDAVVESIHDDHRTLEGKELFDAIVKVFELNKPKPLVTDKK